MNYLIKREALLKALNLSNKIPPEMNLICEFIDVPFGWNYITCKPEHTINLTVKILPSRKSKHRILVECPNCHSFIPCGRMNQHTNTKQCFKNHLKYVKQLRINNDSI